MTKAQISTVAVRSALLAATALTAASCGTFSSTASRCESNGNPPEPAPITTATATATTIVTDSPFLLSTAAPTSAEQATRVPPITLVPRHTGEGVSLYGEVMANAMFGKAGGGEPRGAGAGFTQVSFSQEGSDFDPDVSRDGREIVFASTQHRPTPDIYVKNVESRVVTQLTNDPASDLMPKVSPDGGRIAFASNRSGNWDIFVMPVSGGRAIQLTNNAADDLHPSWSPDGSQLVFCRLGEVSGQWEMWVTDVGNSGVARFIGYGLFPEWCPKSATGRSGADRIAFQKSRERGDRAFGIWTIDYQNGQSGNMTEIASSPIAACINPGWSPDGEWLAFATVPNPGEWVHSRDGRPPSADLWMADLNGSNRISLTTGKAVNLMPAWGPNNRLFYVSDRGGVDNIWVMDTTTVMELAAANMKASPSLAAMKAAKPGSSSSAPVATVPGSEDGTHDPR
jgi:TolB protein